MSSFKRINPNDISISPYISNKSWLITDDYQDYGIDITNIHYSGSIFQGGEEEELLYNSINHLYYQYYINSSLDSGSLLRSLYYEDAIETYRPSGSYYDYMDTTLGNKSFVTGSEWHMTVLSIPKELFGEKINPGTFRCKISLLPFGDDKYGNLYLLDGSEYDNLHTTTLTDILIGNIFYSHGIIVINNQFSSISVNDIFFKAEHTIFENTIKCNVKDYEMNYTYNPTILSNKSIGEVKGNISGSMFQSYMTTVGLYDENNDLLAVGKFPNPLPVSQTTDTSIIVKFDL